MDEDFNVPVISTISVTVEFPDGSQFVHHNVLWLAFGTLLDIEPEEGSGDVGTFSFKSPFLNKKDLVRQLSDITKDWSRR